VCRTEGHPFRSAAEIARDLAETRDHHAGEELKLMHDEAVELFGCDRCGTVWRAAQGVWRSVAQDYEVDRYDLRMVERLHRDELTMARQDRPWLTKHGVGPGRRLLEVASYVGGFLAYAGQEGAAAVGLDLNPQLVQWCRSKGLDARVGTLDRVGWRGEQYDGVWILNCFDQVPRPAELLARARCRLRGGGHLVIRTPNASFIRAAYAGPPALQVAARQHALWGVPHLCCYTMAALSELVSQAGFRVVAVRSRPSNEHVPDNRGGPPWFDLVAHAVEAPPG
jgi:SAM-dependent methyltransferase